MHGSTKQKKIERLCFNAYVKTKYEYFKSISYKNDASRPIGNFKDMEILTSGWTKLFTTAF